MKRIMRRGRGRMSVTKVRRSLAVALPLLAILLASCGRRTPAILSDVEAARLPAVPATPADPAWQSVPACLVALLPQDMVEPRLLAPSTPQVQVQAATDGARIAFRLSWKDSTRDDLPGAARFCDACAIQIPTHVTADLPAPQMGEPGRPVEITYWSSSWQARVDGRKDDITALYPGAAIGHYPFDAASLKPGSPEQAAMARRYAPARAVGNWMAGDGTRSVQDLVAEGPGTLAPASGGSSSGSGRRVEGGWEVVVSRALPPELGTGQITQVALAVWDGHDQETGARKMRSVWVPLLVGTAR